MCVCVCVCVYFCVNIVNVIQSCLTLCNPVDCRPPGSSVHRSVSLAHSEYWNELSFPLEGDLPEPGIEPASHGSPALQAIA